MMKSSLALSCSFSKSTVEYCTGTGRQNTKHTQCHNNERTTSQYMAMLMGEEDNFEREGFNKYQLLDEMRET
jgi:hypothetical protein